MTVEDMRKHRWAGHGSDWPDGHRPCVKCGEMKPFSEYHKHVGCLHGVNTVCKVCRKPLSSKQYQKSKQNYRLWYSARSRARKANREFTITVEDVVIPEICPVLNRPLVKGTDYAPSIDRLDSNKGYTPDNIRIISRRANVLKNNATLSELEMIIDYVRETNS